MLHWLAGAKQPEGADHDTSAVIDPPETPAPVFAVRAFKHAIFGTPQQPGHNPRRHSTNEREKHRPAAAARATRPQITRPKSAGDAAGLIKQDDAQEPMPSPTKGILMTPGTAAARRKTVTFGDHVVDNAKDKANFKEGSKTGLPVDFPGKFPSPWVQTADKTENNDTPGDRKRGRNKLTEELHKARDESAKRKAGQNTDRGDDDQDDAGFAEPDSESGQYWKREYDVYRANTTREVKKLVAKQRAAKGFARDKDMQCTELSDQLRQEKKRADKLEMRAAELEAQIVTLQAQLESARTSSPARAARAPARRSVLVGEGATTAAKPTHSRSRSTDLPSVVGLHGELAAKSSEPDSYRARARKPSLDLQAETAGARSRVRHQPGNLPSDLWAHSLASPGPPTPSKADPPNGITRNGRTVTSGTNLTPLKSLSINSQQKNRSSRQESPQRSPGAEQAQSSTPAFLRDNSKLAPPTDEAQDTKRCDSLDLDISSKARVATEKPASRHSPLLPSSTFEPDAPPYPSAATTTDKPLPARPARSGRTESKENVSPSRAGLARSVGEKGDVDSLQVPRMGATCAPLTARDGTEVGEDRLAAARARLAARGRKIS